MRPLRLLGLFLVLAVLSGAPGALAEAGDFEITDLHVQSDGSIYVAWRDDLAAGPYRVLFQALHTTLENEEAPTNEATVWCNSGDVEGDHYVEPYIAPDYDYWFILQAADGRQTWAKYKGEENKGYGWVVKFQPVSIYKSGSSTSYDAINQFSEEDLLAMDEKHSYGLKVTFYTDKSIPGNNPGNDVATLMLVADIMRQPHVLAYTETPVADGLAIHKDLGDWFRRLDGDSGIPPIFTVKAYLNGGIVDQEMIFIK